MFTASAQKSSGMSPSRPGVTAKARPSESTTLAIAGTAREENGGTIASQATIRTEASRYAISGSPAREMVMVWCRPGSREQPGEALEQVDGEVHQGVQHPVAAD